MSGKYKPQWFTKSFVMRTKMLREAAGFETHRDMAQALGIKPDTYAKYETRSCLPHHLMPKFVSLTGGSYNLLLGKARGATE